MKKVTCLLALLVVLVAAVPAHAQSFIGTYCFTYDAYADVWVWKVTYVTDNTYAISGWTPLYPAVLTGSARVITGTTMQGSLVETMAAGGTAGVKSFHGFTLNLANYTGVDYHTYFLNSGTVGGAQSAVTFHLVTCPAGAQVESSLPPLTSVK